jgi:hypothetical protein
MLRHQRLILTAAALLSCLALAAIWTQRSAGQAQAQNPKGHIDASIKQPPSAGKLGKYQIAAWGQALIMCDTETGQLWTTSDKAFVPSSQNWAPMKSPTGAK